MPRIERFHALHPRLSLRVDARDLAVDPRRDDVDVAVRFGPGDYPGLHVEALPRQPVYPVCSPGLLERGPPLASLADLGGHTLLQVEWRHATTVAPPGWAWWLAAVEAPPFDAGGGPRFSQQAMAIEAAAAGQGIALADGLLAGDNLAAGRLVRPFEAEAVPDLGYFLVCTQDAAESARVHAFRDWIRAEMGA